MATNTANIMVGSAVVTIAPWVTAEGVSAGVDVGHTKAPITLAASFEDFAVKSERALSTLMKVPQDMAFKLKIPMLETTIDHFRIAVREPAASVSGTGADLTLDLGNPIEQYHRIIIVGPGIGTTGVRTITAWRTSVESVGEIAFGKGVEQMIEVTFDCLYDDSVTGVDNVMNIVDA